MRASLAQPSAHWSGDRRTARVRRRGAIAHLEENVSAAGLELTADERAALDAAALQPTHWDDAP